MIAGVSSKHSLFDCTKNTVSIYTYQDENALSYLQTMGMTYDPVVVDNTAQLDRIFEWLSRCIHPFPPPLVRRLIRSRATPYPPPRALNSRTIFATFRSLQNGRETPRHLHTQ